MKKMLSVLLVLCCIFTMCFTTGCAAQRIEEENNTVIVLTIGNPVMTVNGSTVEIDPGRGTAPVIVNDRTLIPVRSVIETMGGTVDWNEETQTAALTYGEDEIRLTLNSTTAYLNDEAQILDVAPVSINDRTMLPIRFISESFEFAVEWNGDAQTVTITKNAEKEGSTTSQPAVDNPTDIQENTRSQAIVVYFSATGNTKALAQTIAQAANADLWEIIPEDPYTTEDLNYNNDNCRANIEMNNETSRPAISETIENIDAYDTIFLGYPIWWGTMPRIINTFLDTYDLSDKTILPFCTSGGSGISSSVSAIKNACLNADVKKGLRGTSSTTAEQVKEWMTENGYENNETDITPQISEERKIRLSWEDKEVIIAMENNKTVDDFLSKLPMTVVFEDYNNTEKIAYLDNELVKDEEAAGCKPEAGTFALYAPWGNLSVFYKEWSYTGDLIPMGEIESGLEDLTSMTDDFTVTIDLID